MKWINKRPTNAKVIKEFKEIQKTMNKLNDKIELVRVLLNLKE